MLLLLLPIMRGAKLADVTPCPGDHHAARGEHVAAQHDAALKWPNMPCSTKAPWFRWFGARTTGQAYENRLYPLEDLLLRLLLSN